MPAKTIDGKKIAQGIQDGLKKEISALGEKPCLAIVLAGNSPASETYVAKKLQACKELGMVGKLVRFGEKVSQQELSEKVRELNADSSVNAILVQLPLPSHINEQEIVTLVDAKKDVDGLCLLNEGKLFCGIRGLYPCTPLGIVELIQSVGKIEGKHAVVVGRSNLVGKPVALLLLAKNATVTLCHSKTKNLGEHTKNADILVVAVGKPKSIRADMVKSGAIVIDVGTTKVDGKLVGDVDFEKVMEIAGAITPVPGGVGPMTVAMLARNVLAAHRMQKEESAGGKKAGAKKKEHIEDLQ